MFAAIAAIVLTVTSTGTATSTASTPVAPARVPGGPRLSSPTPEAPPARGRGVYSKGERLAKKMAEALQANRLTKGRAIRSFKALRPSDQRSFLKAWARDVPASPRSERVLADLRRIYVERIERTNRITAAAIATAAKPGPSESGLVVGGLAAATGVSFLWRIVIGAIIAGADVGRDSAIGFLVVDSLATSLIVGSMAYWIASTSDHYDVSYGSAVLGATVGYLAAFCVTLAIVLGSQDSTGRQIELGTGSLVGIAIVSVVVPPIGAVIGTSASKTPKRRGRRRVQVDPWSPRRPSRTAMVHIPIVSFGF